MTDKANKMEIADIVGRQLENMIALLVNLGGKLNEFQVHSGLGVNGEDYRYMFVVAHENNSTFRDLERIDDEVR